MVKWVLVKTLKHFAVIGIILFLVVACSQKPELSSQTTSNDSSTINTTVASDKLSGTWEQIFEFDGTVLVLSQIVFSELDEFIWTWPSIDEMVPGTYSIFDKDMDKMIALTNSDNETEEMLFLRIDENTIMLGPFQFTRKSE